MEILANELRIGNWVQRPESVRIDILDGGKIYWLVDSLMIIDCEYYKDNWAFEPIPLTPEILEKCGFKKSLNGYCYGMITNDGKNRFSIFTDGTFKLGTQDLSVNILHLHQLQNLYFALTGEELTFKP